MQRTKEEKEQKIAVLEEAKAAVEGELGELRANLREVEKSRMEARRELQELRRQVAVSQNPTINTFVCLEFWGYKNYYRTGNFHH